MFLIRSRIRVKQKEQNMNKPANLTLNCLQRPRRLVALEPRRKIDHPEAAFAVGFDALVLPFHYHRYITKRRVGRQIEHRPEPEAIRARCLRQLQANTGREHRRRMLWLGRHIFAMPPKCNNIAKRWFELILQRGPKLTRTLEHALDLANGGRDRPLVIFERLGGVSLAHFHQVAVAHHPGELPIQKQHEANDGKYHVPH